MAQSAIDSIKKAEQQAKTMLSDAATARDTAIINAENFSHTLFERSVADADTVVTEYLTGLLAVESTKLSELDAVNSENLAKIESAAVRNMDKAVGAILNKLG